MQEAAKEGAFIEFVGGSLTAGDANARLDPGLSQAAARHQLRRGRRRRGELEGSRVRLHALEQRQRPRLRAGCRAVARGQEPPSGARAARARPRTFGGRFRRSGGGPPRLRHPEIATACRPLIAAPLEREGVALLQRGHSHARAWVLGVPFSTASFSPLAYAHGDRRHSSLTCWWSRHAKLRHIACERQFTSQRWRYLRGFPRGDSWDKSCSELPC